ncbi:MAG: 50S ribosomal protein L32 [Patescibacteria group bacterium]
MGTPTKKRTSGQRKRRASHFALRSKSVRPCPKCKKPVLPHHACAFCGYYKGRQVMTVAVEARKPGTAAKK